MSAKPSASSNPAKPSAKPKPKPEAPAPALPKTIGGIAVFGEMDPAAAVDPVQAAMDAAVAEHNAAVLAAQAGRVKPNGRT